ncbi:hypothetical protein HFP57_00285 [Parasphingopyxis algicola]|nr:hypothetical protein HFP57_00285 [Parasphingopyxis algicola]
MFWITVFLAFAAAAGTVYFLVRGIVAFLATTEAELTGDGPSESARAQNRAMQGRVLLQAVAVGLALLALTLVAA